jgi:hypothetical protein
MKPTDNKGKELDFEHFHTPRILSNAMSWGYQTIPKHLYEVANFQEITYEKKRQVIVRMTSKKRRLSLDSATMITME